MWCVYMMGVSLGPKKNKVLIHAKNTDEPRKKKPVTKTTYHKVPLV